jgi:hypothetical protein
VEAAHKAFQRQFNIGRHGRVPSAYAINTWVHNFEETDPLHRSKFTVSSSGIIGWYIFEENDGLTTTDTSIQYAGKLHCAWICTIFHIKLATPGSNKTRQQRTQYEYWWQLYGHCLVTVSFQGTLKLHGPQDHLTSPHVISSCGVILKSEGYRTRPTATEELKARIRGGITRISVAMLRHVRRNVTHRLQKCLSREWNYLRNNFTVWNLKISYSVLFTGFKTFFRCMCSVSLISVPKFPVLLDHPQVSMWRATTFFETDARKF